MQKVYEPITLIAEMITSVEYGIPMDRENFIAIIDLDNDAECYEDMLEGKLLKIVGVEKVIYSGGCKLQNVWVTAEIGTDLKLIEKCIDEFIIEARIASDFFSDGEEIE